jgi:uncharacterized iron-regulated membrane protein
MDLAKFTAYSAAGNLLFALALAYAAYARHGWLAALRERWPLFLLLALVLLALLVWAWLRRRHLRERPAHEVARAWKGAALIVTAAALALLLFALLAPHLATALVDAIAIDRAEWVRARGLAPVVNALLLAGELLIAGLLALALSRAVATLAHRIARRLGP